jgi:hypothetical protein
VACVHYTTAQARLRAQARKRGLPTLASEVEEVEEQGAGAASTPTAWTIKQCSRRAKVESGNSRNQLGSGRVWLHRVRKLVSRVVWGAYVR